MPSRPNGQTVAAATPLRRSSTAPTQPTSPSALPPLLPARPLKLVLAVTSMAALSPTSQTRNASFTARGLRTSPGGIASAVGRMVTASEGAGPGPVSPRAPRITSGAGGQLRSAAGVTSRWCCPKGARGPWRSRAPPGATSGDGRRVMATQCIRSEVGIRATPGGRKLRTTGEASPPQPAFRPEGNERLPPRAFLPPAPHLALLGLGPFGWQPRPALIDRTRAVGCVRAPPLGILARWLKISRRGWPQIGYSTLLTSWPGTFGPSWLHWPAPPRFLWSRQDPSSKPRLSGFLDTQQGTQCVAVLLYTGPTHYSTCARRPAARRRLARPPPL